MSTCGRSIEFGGDRDIAIEWISLDGQGSGTRCQIENGPPTQAWPNDETSQIGCGSLRRKFSAFTRFSHDKRHRIGIGTPRGRFTRGLKRRRLGRSLLECDGNVRRRLRRRLRLGGTPGCRSHFFLSRCVDKLAGMVLTGRRCSLRWFRRRNVLGRRGLAGLH